MPVVMASPYVVWTILPEHPLPGAGAPGTCCGLSPHELGHCFWIDDEVG